MGRSYISSPLGAYMTVAGQLFFTFTPYALLTVVSNTTKGSICSSFDGIVYSYRILVIILDLKVCLIGYNLMFTFKDNTEICRYVVVNKTTI
jgi:hypothetical protein